MVFRVMTEHRKKWFFWAVTLLVAVVAAFPLLRGGGLLNTRGGGDSPFLLQRVYQLVTAVSDGHFPVRWMPDANYGYGYPFFNFYAPLSIYIAGFFKLFGFSFVQSIQLAQLLGFVVAAVGMFALVRRWFGHEWTAVLAAIAYTVAPFHMVNVYVRGDSLAEFWAMAFYPFVILAADWLFDRVASGQWQVAGALFALAYAALILSHNISALIFTPFLLLYLLIRWLYELWNRGDAEGTENKIDQGLRRFLSLRLGDFARDKNIWRPVIVLGVAGLLAVGLAAFFVIPALGEKEYTQLGAVTEGYFHFSNHFLGTAVQPAIQSTFFVSYNPDGLEAFRMGLVQAAAIIVGVVALLWTWRSGEIRPYRRIYIILVLLLSTLMFLPLSRWAWEHLPLLDFTQFPWRFLSVQAFAGSLMIGAIGLLPWRKVLVSITAVLLIVSSLGDLHPDYLPLSDADVTDYHLAQYEWFTGNIGTTISFEYLPPTVVPRPYTSDWLNRNDRFQPKALTGYIESAQLLFQKTTEQEWQIEVSESSQIIFPTMYWHGWTAQLNGETVPIVPADGSGLIALELPAGTHDIVLQLQRIPLRLFAELLSLLALLILLWLCRSAYKKAGKVGVPVLGSLLLLFLLGQLWPQPTYSQNDLTWDFAQMGYLHHDIAGVSFDNDLILEGYDYSADTLRPNEPFTVTLLWQTAVPAEVTLALYSPAVHRASLAGSTEPPPIVAQTETVNGRFTTFQFTVPQNAPEGLFVPRLLFKDATALTPSGLARGPLFLRPLMIIDTAVPVQRTPQLDVSALDVTQRDASTFDIQLLWRTDAQISANYNLNLRLTDAHGQFLQLVDMQPGYGYQPSGLWPTNHWVSDWLAMPLPEGNHQLPYILVATLYDVRDPQTAVLQRKLGELHLTETGLTFQAHMPNFELPAGVESETAVFGEMIALKGHQVNQADDEIDITLYWEVLASTSRSYTRFVHLIDPTTDQPPVVQSDAIPQYGTYPTNQWQVGEIVADQVVLSTQGLPAGEYQLALGYYEVADDGSFPRLTAVSPDGTLLPEDRFILSIPVTIDK